MQLLAEARKVLLVKHQQWDAVYWKRNVVVDRALSPPGLVLHKFTKLLDCCSYMQAAKRVLSGSFNSERFLGSVVDKPSEPFFESLVSWWYYIVLYCIVLYCIVGKRWEEQKLLFFHILDTELHLQAQKANMENKKGTRFSFNCSSNRQNGLCLDLRDK